MTQKCFTILIHLCSAASLKVCCDGSFHDISDGPVPHGAAQSSTSRNIPPAFLSFLLLQPTCHGYRGLCVREKDTDMYKISFNK